MRRKIIYALIILVSLFSVIYSLQGRIKVESEAKKVEIDLDYYEMKLLSEQSDMTLLDWFKEFEKMGIYGVALEEETLNSMKEKYNKQLDYVIANNVINNSNRYKEFPYKLNSLIDNKNIDKYDLIVRTTVKGNRDFILEGIKERYPKEILVDEFFSDNIYYIILNGTFKDAEYVKGDIYIDVYGKRRGNSEKLVSSKLEYIGLGFDDKKIEIIKKSGLKPVLRPINYERYPDKLVEAFKNELKEHNIDQRILIFSGGSVLGYDESRKNLVELEKFMLDSAIYPALIETSVQRENIEQEGLINLVENFNYKTVRVFPILNYIQKRYKYYNYDGAEEIENTMYRAITERNIRIVYFRPFLKEEREYVTDLDDYIDTFNNLKYRLLKHNIKYGEASIYNEVKGSIVVTTLISLGLVVFSIILLKSLINISEKLENTLLIVSLVSIYPALYIAPNLFTHVLALIASIIFPALATLMLLEYVRMILVKNKIYKTKQVYLKSILILGITVFIAMLGGFYVAGILRGSKFLFELEIFRGVKLSQLMPFLIFVIIYIIKFGFKRDLHELSESEFFIKDLLRVLDEKIKVLYVMLGSLTFIVGYIYIARTGHETNIQPSDLEMIFRNFLEMKLIVRPRTKEMLFAFPSIVILSYFSFRGCKKSVFPLSLIAVMGYASVVNTFSHIRTPFYLSFLRTIYGVVLGGMIGIFIITILNSFMVILRKVREKKIYD